MTKPLPTFQLIKKDGRYVIFPVHAFPEWTDSPEDDHWALEASIAKWQFVVSNLENPKQLRGHALNDGGTATCGLCLLDDYRTADLMEWCTTCAIYKVTGLRGCGNTPYDEYCVANNNEDALEAARAELAFLKSLR